MTSLTTFSCDVHRPALVIVCAALTVGLAGCSITSPKMERMPMLYRPLHGVSQGKIAQHSPSRSVDTLTAELEDDPSNLRLLEDRGWAFAKLGKYDQAIRDFTTACDAEQSPDPHLHARLLCRAGITYYAMGKYPEAIEAFSSAIEIDEENWELYFHRWQSLQAAGRTEEAAADKEKGLSLNPSVFNEVYSTEGGII